MLERALKFVMLSIEQLHLKLKCEKSYSGNNIFNSIDINECEHYNDTCNSNASCTNSEGSFSCSCLPGFTGDGFEVCMGKYKTVAFETQMLKILLWL